MKSPFRGYSSPDVYLVLTSVFEKAAGDLDRRTRDKM